VLLRLIEKIVHYLAKYSQDIIRKKLALLPPDGPFSAMPPGELPAAQHIPQRQTL